MTFVFNDGPHGSLPILPGAQRSALLCDPRLPSEVQAKLHEMTQRQGGTDKVWIASSGTTRAVGALPKIVVHSDSSMRRSACAVNKHLQVQPEDAWLSALPDFHVGGLGIQYRAREAGLRMVRTVGNQAAWDPRIFVDDLNASQATLCSLVPAQLFDLVRAKFAAPKNLRVLVIGGQALAPLLFVAARALGWPVLTSYGMTETGSQIATASLESLTHDVFPVMRPLDQVEVRTGVDQILQARAASMFEGYLEAGASGKYQFSDPKQDGWFTSSDRASLTMEGSIVASLVVHGRVGEAFKIGGELVERQQLEAELVAAQLAVPYVTEASLQIVDDERLGAAVELLAVDRTTGEQLAAVFNERVSGAGRIRRVQVVPSIARTALGKPLRNPADNLLPK